MKTWMIEAPAGALLLALVACGSPAAPSVQDPAGTVIGAPHEITLKLGEERTVGGEVLHIGFQDVVEDSRCPVDVVCVHPGNALVSVGIHMGMGPTHELRMNTALEPRSVKWNDILVTLLALDPLPRAGQPKDSLAYVARLRIEPVSQVR